MNTKLLKEACKRLAKAKFEVFRLQDIASELSQRGLNVEEVELEKRLQEARDWLEAADRQLRELGAYR